MDPISSPAAHPFTEPWQAQAFAMTLALHERGLFTWAQWAQALGEAIARAQSRGDPDRGDTYWQHWLDALEQLVTTAGAGSVDELHRHREAWDRAAHRTPHGAPIELQPEDFKPA